MTAAVTLTFTGVGTALLLTQPEDSFGGGVGLGHAMWAAAAGAQTILDIVMMKRARRRGRQAPPRVTSLWAWRLNVMGSAVVTAGGLGAVVAGLTIDDAQDAAGVGAVYATYGAALLAFSIWDLLAEKRRRKRCQETCPSPSLTGGFAMRF